MARAGQHLAVWLDRHRAMADLSLSELISLVFEELATSLDATSERAQALKLRVSDVNLELPAHLSALRVTDAEGEQLRLMLALPSTREQPAPGRLGRVRIVVESEQRTADEEAV